MPDNPVLSLNHHASIWWGGLLLIFGVFYCYRFSRRGTGANAGTIA